MCRDKWQHLEQVQAKDDLSKALLSCHAAILVIRSGDKISAGGPRGLLIFFLQRDRVREFGIFSTCLVTSSEFGRVENVTQSNYKLAFQTGWEVPCFVLLLWIVALSIRGD